MNNRVLIVDDHEIIRRGLVQVLKDLNESNQFDEANDGPSAMQKLRKAQYNAVLLDIALGERDGFDLLKSIRNEFPELGVVMLSVYPESQFAVRAIRSGAHAYLNKGCSPVELNTALAKAMQGQMYVNSGTATLLAMDIRCPTGRAPHEKLSNRELEVLRALAVGQTISEIASQLNLSSNTVSTYRTRVFEKLGLKNLVDLVNYARQHGLDMPVH
ncbi:MAG: response regulator transcription factor [Limnobacter sp.]|nr:response regulator transcription factor [Limnobacter sp.]